MARRILNRKELRADYEADERRRHVDDPDAEAAEDEGDEDEDEEEEAAQGDEEAGDEEDEEAGATKKKPAKPKAKPKSRSRTAKVARLRLVWGVFNNSHQQVATYEYPKKDEAIAHAAKLTADKKTTHFVQPVKEPIGEQKE